MKKLPDVILASDGIYEKQALREAEILNIQSFAVFNTNGDIDLVSNLIPANTNSTKSFDYLAEELKGSFVKFTAPQARATVRKVEDKQASRRKKTLPQARKPRAKKEETAEIAEAPKAE